MPKIPLIAAPLALIISMPAPGQDMASISQPAEQGGAVAAAAGIDAILDRIYPVLDQTYKDLHAHPEVAFRETRSAGILAGRMREIGFEVTENIGTTGLVAIMRNG